MSREKSGSSQSWGSHIVVMDAGGRVAAGRKLGRLRRRLRLKRQFIYQCFNSFERAAAHGPSQ